MKTHVHLAHVIFSLHVVIHVLHLDVIRRQIAIMKLKFPLHMAIIDVVGKQE